MRKFCGLGGLFQHMNWADATVWRSVLQVSNVESDLRVRDLLYHIHIVQHAFLCIWSKKPSELDAFRDLTAICRWGYTYHQEVMDYLDKIEELSLERRINIPWTDQIEKQLGKSPQPATLAETMHQVISHSAYHRGQVNAHIRELGGEPPLIDFIAWVWLGKPKADWPENIAQ